MSVLLEPLQLLFFTATVMTVLLGPYNDDADDDDDDDDDDENGDDNVR